MPKKKIGSKNTKNNTPNNTDDFLDESKVSDIEKRANEIYEKAKITNTPIRKNK